jgi:hypothetical protein
MNQQRLTQAIDVLREIGQAIANLPEERQKATDAWLSICDSALYLTEMRHHLEDGKDAYDALLAAVRGEMLVATNGVSVRFGSRDE